MTALMTAAIDPRVSGAVVSDYFDCRDRCWAEPADRRLRGQLTEFGDAELAALVAPRNLTIEASESFLGAATDFNAEHARAMRFYEGLAAGTMLKAVKRRVFDPKAMLREYRQMAGVLPEDGTPMNVRSELASTTGKFRIYRVTIDVRKGVSVYGNLVVPTNIKGKRPAVICQHGFGGYPNKITGLGMTEDTVYREYGRKLAEKGYVVFAPMLLHISPSEEVSRQMRQANAVDMMRLAMPLAKTERVIDFLESLPFVDPKRIGYYGLSYGGYSSIAY